MQKWTGLAFASLVRSFLLSRFWVLRRKERSQGKSEPEYFRNSKETELLELREGQMVQAHQSVSKNMVLTPSFYDRKVLEDLEGMVRWDFGKVPLAAELG